jgi:beta-galactosidase
MDRRKFLKSSGAVAASAALSNSSLGALLPDAVPSVGRTVLSLNRNWKYTPRRVEGASARDFDDSSFDSVTIPHTNRVVPWHSFDDKDYEFISTYRRRFRLPTNAFGKRVFIDFGAAMTASTVWINGQRLGEYKGGYTPFSFDLTQHIDRTGENVLVVELDSTERADIPPFGGNIDYLTFGGIYRDVALRIVPQAYLQNIFARPRDVLSDAPTLDVACYLGGSAPAGLRFEVELRDGDRVLGHPTQPLPKTIALAEADAGTPTAIVSLTNFGPITKWDLDKPYLYTVVVRLKQGNAVIDEDRCRFGFREAKFTDHGFELNGKVVKLRGLDRHQTFPWVGQAMGARVQRRDAHILRKELKINMVRTSHYPQSPHFLDACDELGLLVLEEIPGWQHIGDQAWKDLSIDNVRRMITRDWNHPSIVLWGVRINESGDDHDFYTRTNALAHQLDPTRQTGGIRYNYQSELLEDVFTMNDFGFPLRPPNHPLYLNTEFCGHTYPTKPYDTGERLTEHALRHARVHNQLGSDARYAGGLGWCAFDYDTHKNFGSGDRICYHGVSDIFRIAKPAGSFYASQCDPAEEIVVEPAFEWDAHPDYSGGLANKEKAAIFSNCDHLKLFAGEQLVAEVDPNREEFPHLAHPPFQFVAQRTPTADLRIEGYIGGKKVIEKQYATNGVDEQLVVQPDDAALIADGGDCTRVVFRVADRYGNLRRYSTGAISFALDGPADMIGDNPFSLVAGTGAIWIRARQQPGTVVLRATHAKLGTKEVRIEIRPAPQESA